MHKERSKPGRSASRREPERGWLSRQLSTLEQALRVLFMVAQLVHLLHEGPLTGALAEVLNAIKS